MQVRSDKILQLFCVLVGKDNHAFPCRWQGLAMDIHGYSPVCVFPLDCDTLWGFEDYPRHSFFCFNK